MLTVRPGNIKDESGLRDESLVEAEELLGVAQL